MTAIIDVDSVMFAIGNGNKLLDEDKIPIKDSIGKFIYTEKSETELAQSADWIMNDILTSCNADGYIAYIKGKNTTSERKLINPEYKANRPKESPKWWSFTKQYLIDKWKVIPADNYEVDDYVNVTLKMLPDSFIIAIDKDLLGLEGRHFNWRKKEWVEVTKAQEEYNFWASMITGDTADNIKGLPGKGIKFVEKVLLKDTIRIGEYNVERSYVQTNYQIILEEYVNHFGESEGIKEFYKNYFSLKIADKIEGFVIPEIITFKKESNEETEEKILF